MTLRRKYSHALRRNNSATTTALRRRLRVPCRPIQRAVSSAAAPVWSPGLAEDVVEGRGLQVVAVDDVEQLGVAVGDGGQVGVGDHDLLGLKRFPGVADEAVFVLRSRVPDVTAPHGDRGIP